MNFIHIYMYKIKFMYKIRVELYLYSPSGPHQACNGITLHFTNRVVQRLNIPNLALGRGNWLVSHLVTSPLDSWDVKLGGPQSHCGLCDREDHFHYLKLNSSHLVHDLVVVLTELYWHFLRKTAEHL